VFLEEELPVLKNYNKRKQVCSLQYDRLENIDELLLIAVINSVAEITNNSRKAWKEL